MLTTYDGREFSGFQKQKNARSIQGELENALSLILKEEITCVGSGRTDAGVSAYMQPVHFETDKNFDEQKLLKSMNGILPKKDSCVIRCSNRNSCTLFSQEKNLHLQDVYVKY